MKGDGGRREGVRRECRDGNEKGFKTVKSLCINMDTFRSLDLKKVS